MQAATPDPAGRETRSSADLPYGALPLRSDGPAATPIDPLPLEHLVDLSWLERDPPPEQSEAAHEADSAIDEERSESSGGDVSDPGGGDVSDSAGEDVSGSSGEDVSDSSGGSSEPSPGLPVTRPTQGGDDDVHFGVAARALGVSRKTVERMVKRGQLQRGPSNAPATISKRALVALLEQRQRDITHLTRAAELEKAESGNRWLSAESAGESASALRELLVPILAPLLDEFVAVQTRAAVLETQLESIKVRTDLERRRDELLVALATRGWWARKKARKSALRYYVLGEKTRSDTGKLTRSGTAGNSDADHRVTSP